MANIRLFDSTVNDPFESMFRRFMSPMRMDRKLDELEIRVDVVEKDGVFKVRADLPGVKKEDINIRIDGNLVQIDAETKGEKEFKGEGGKVLRSERYYGSVSRAFTLTQDVDDTKAVAKYEDGVLTLELPKKATSSSKRLAIS
ncbi:MAG: Hsp20/alpha crystallin family protein [Rhodoferax sp.]|nr:Hsp20/alpha crystallin family protein [Rhodoferax sp.]